MTIKIVYFSGTGSTQYAADIFAREIEKKGHTALMYRIFHDSPDTIDEFDMLIVFFPVYAFNAPKPVTDWIKKTAGQKKPAAVISVSGGGDVSANKASRVGVKKALAKKGFSVFYEQMILMPSNCLERTPLADGIEQAAAVPLLAAQWAADILAQKERLVETTASQRFTAWLGLAEQTGGILFGSAIKAEPSCTGCSLCARECPAGNITMKNGRPQFGKKCAFCLHCIYSCPAHALKPGFLKSFVFSEGYNFNTFITKKAD